MYIEAPFHGQRRMNIDDAGSPDSNLSGSIFCQCAICQAMDEKDTQILYEYVEEVSKSHSLSTVIKLAFEFVSVMEKKNLSGDQTLKKYDFDDQDVIKHVIYCIGTRLSSLRNMVCNTKSMHLLLSASNANQISTAIKLLQGSQGKTAKEPQE